MPLTDTLGANLGEYFTGLLCIRLAVIPGVDSVSTVLACVIGSNIVEGCFVHFSGLHTFDVSIVSSTLCVGCVTDLWFSGDPPLT
jgi:hypothetical protein